MNRQVLLRFLLLLGLVLQPNHGGALAACSSALSGASGAQLEINVYYPFGRTQTATPQASCQVSRRFTGQVFDSESGLYYYHARYYDPELGRFLQPDDLIPDMANPQSYNRYSYCINDPLRYNDPTGHDPTIGLAFEAAGLSVEARVNGSRMLLPVAVGVAAGMATGGAATPLLIGAGASATVAAIGSGVAAGAMGDLAAQATQTGLGTRQSISGKEVAVSAAVGGALAGTASTAGKVASALSEPAAETTAADSAPYAGQTLYRVYGGDSAAGGASWSPVNPGSVANYRDAAGLPSGGASGFNNTGSFVIEGTLQDPAAVVNVRSALPLDGNSGGILEYVVPNWQKTGAIQINRVSGVNPQF